jgi:TolA-binding protein
MCAAAFGFAVSAQAQTPPVPVPAQAQPAAVTAPPVRPLPPTVEERDDPFQPPPTEVEKRAEDERRLRDLMRPLIDQMRESINQGVNNQIQDGVRGALEEYGRQSREVQQGAAGKPGKSGKTRASAGADGADRSDPEDDKDDKAEARLQAALEKATEMAKDADPFKRQEGLARLEQIRRGQMPKWSSSEGVFFIGCINKRKLYRDRFGDIFHSELWFNGSSGAGGTGGNSYAAAARPAGQQTASASAPVGSGATANVASVDPCAD